MKAFQIVKSSNCQIIQTLYRSFMRQYMDRSQFITSLLLLSMAKAMDLKEFGKITGAFGDTDTMPALFIGHGSPMNAIEDNEFGRSWEAIGREITRPSAILCISAHWETKGTLVTAMEKPKTIHDFGGFPKELFDVLYPAPGSSKLAEETKNAIHKTSIGLDNDWGLDHGAWSVLKHIYPLADVPVIQMSLDYTQPAQYHYELAKELAALRRKGILIVGSGNMVHNLRITDFSMPNQGHDWAIEANEMLKRFISSHDDKALINYQALGRAVALSTPTPEHYLPLLYTLALRGENENLSFFNDKMTYGSIAMTSVRIG
jgi:4,5-DOPA dioxygenase extradiol